MANGAALLVLPLLPSLLERLPESTAASFVEVVGRQSAAGGLRWFVLGVIFVGILNAFTAGVTWQRSGQTLRRIVHAAVAMSLRPAILVDVLLLLEHFLSDLMHFLAKEGYTLTGQEGGPGTAVAFAKLSSAFSVVLRISVNHHLHLPFAPGILIHRFMDNLSNYNSFKKDFKFHAVSLDNFLN